MTAQRRSWWALVAAFVSVVLVLPVLTMLSGSLRRPGLAPPRGLEVVPPDPGLDAYRTAFDLAPLGRSLLNSLIVAVFFVPIAVLSASLAGFAIARASAHARRRLGALVLMALMVPVTSLWVARFVVFDAFGLVGTYVPLIAPALLGGSPFAVLLYVAAFRRIPTDIYDAARLEGAPPLAIWRSIAMPLARGTTLAVAMLAFVQSWSDLINPLLFLNREESYTAPLALRYLEQLGSTNWPVLLAGAVAVTVPAAVAFVLAQRAFLKEGAALSWTAR